MKDSSTFRVYAGDGSTIQDRSLETPQMQKPPDLDEPSGYLAEPGLRDAVNVAISLGQPLLITGEPGTGKTQLAGSIAHELGFGEPLVSNVKTTSSARDLFYRYDALRHFHDAQFSEGTAVAVDDYIEYDALGLAILLAMEAESVNRFLPEALRNRGPTRSVVLVDEIDKAPRDLPNDVLNEIEQMAFTVKETGRTFQADSRFQPVVVLTSNSERTLPDAFLRRCVFYHIEFPSDQRMLQIIERRLPELALSEDRIGGILRQFGQIRELALKKKPATAELLSWVRVLERLDLDVENRQAGDLEALRFTYTVLAKGREDLAMLQDRFAPRAADEGV